MEPEAEAQFMIALKQLITQLAKRKLAPEGDSYEDEDTGRSPVLGRVPMLDQPAGR